MKTPDLDLNQCSLCLGCIEIAPAVFRLNPTGYIEVIDLDHYPEDQV
ncbi:MAG: ferredoxin, partial [Deltaproteobacteria bacterium]|nr:ferredoxin [Deltaproteobacteria bacterium]